MFVRRLLVVGRTVPLITTLTSTKISLENV